MDAGVVTSWTPGIAAPLGDYADTYPYAGWAQQWSGTRIAGTEYGGPSVIQSPIYDQYVTPSGVTAIDWTDQVTQGAPLGNLNVMAFDSDAISVVAGNSTLANFTGGLVTLAAGRTYSVSTSVTCPNLTAASLARFRLVTAGTGAGTTYSSTLTAPGPLAWSFTIPAGATGAYLAVESLTGDPGQVVTFTRPVIKANMGANNAALGYLGGANAVPMRITQVQMPAYYRKAGWPTKAPYLLKSPGSLAFTGSTLPGTIGPPVQVSPKSISTAANLRFLPNENYNQSTGLWTPWYSIGGGPQLTFQAQAGVGAAPYYASTTDNEAFSYNLGGDTPMLLPSLQFDPSAGTWLYSDDLNSAGLTAYTVILVASLNNTYTGAGGLWSSAPKATGGGPDTDAALGSFNYRVVNASGPTLVVSSKGTNQPKSIQIGDAARLHKPCYFVFTFTNPRNIVQWADTPASVMTSTMSLVGVSGALNGSVVLGADAINGLASGAFTLFELSFYNTALTSLQAEREIKLLGQAYG